MNHIATPSGAIAAPLRLTLLTLALSALSLHAAPAELAAQEGTIAYSHTVENNFEIPDEMRARLEARGGRGGRGGPGGEAPRTRTSEVLLLFNSTHALMKPVPRELRAGRREAAGPGGGGGDRAAAIARRMRQRSTARGDQETLIESYTDFATGTTVESREFLGRTFLIEDQRPGIEWRLGSEQAEFLGYVVLKATAVQDSTTIEAWFTPQIPVMGGPASFGGLPGMILVVSVNDGQEQYSATQVSLSAVAEDVIVAPSDGDEVTREEYERIVEEKLEELRTTRGGMDR
ncbi:MAG: GLPGLI family protein [Longimicrobiales bacterium]|nr:GLPGLI family protein [Longimicrobiales bacterium]